MERFCEISTELTFIKRGVTIMTLVKEELINENILSRTDFERIIKSRENDAKA